MPEGVFVTDLWHRFRLGGTQRELTGDIQQTEQLEGWTTYAATVELYDEPTLVRGAEVDIYQVDFQLSTTVPQFSGFVNKVRASSRPNTVKLDLLGPLYRLRRATLSGMNLTGMTEGEAWKAIMDACNVPYADADVADSGYVLGDQVSIFWRREQQGWEIIRELDQVFGMATIEVHAGRVVRFPYDRVPDQSMIFRTYTAFSDADLFSLDREYWGLDEIVNSWEVRGATWQDANNCSYTPWAKADGPNDAFETPGTRVSRKPFSSDLIQDEALAEAVVRRLMRWWNRDPDFIGVITDNNPNVLPGTIIGVKDDKNYGIGLTTAATTNPYLVLTIDRRGSMMELHCVGGDAGDEGTVTHGIEKRCNQTLSTGDLPGLYLPPLIDVPPFYIPEPYVCLDFGGPGGVCPDTGGGTGDPFCLTSSAPATWFNEPGVAWTISGSDITSDVGANSVADTNEKIPRIAGKPVSYTVTFNATVNGAGGFELYATDNDEVFPVHWYFTYMTAGSGGADTQLYDYDAWTGGSNLPLEWGDATDGATVAISISWDRPTETITASVGGVTHTLTGAVDGTTGGGLFFVAISHSFGTLGDPASSHITNFTISIDEDASLASCN